MKKATQFYAEGNLSSAIKDEWMTKEEGSWEDAGKPEGDPNNTHVYMILSCSPKGKWRCYNKHQGEVLLKSAEYHTEWDGDDRLEKDLMKAASRIKATLKGIISK